MIELTVRTLDSQNHPFTVDDDITVEQFKTKIAETVNIPAETQRIIYCGRVLNDNSKLSEYDVNGKVVHLVQRAPPVPNQRQNRPASPQPTRRGIIRGFEHGNAMYLGSMAFPSNLMESQGFVPPPPTHSLAGSRLNVARRMLRRAEAVIRLLENPASRPTELSPQEENFQDEVTPVIEARVIVPNSTTEPIDEAMVLSVVQNSLFNAANGGVPITREENVLAQPSSTEDTSRPDEQSTTSTSESSTPRASSSENLTNEPTRSDNNSAGNPFAENASRTSEMAELLAMLGQLQTRFAPFLERYQNFMQNDPVVAPENVRQTQTWLSRVSEVLHFLSHSYHSLSDIIVRVRTPPPRPLLCRPILIQHSAVVQAGIPIQVEINLSTDRPSTSASTTNAQTRTTTSTSATAETTSNTTESSESIATTNSGPTLPTQAPQGFLGFPLPTGMRVQSFPVVVPAGNLRPQNNNNNTVSGSDSATSTTSTNSTAPPASTASSNSGTNFFNLNNPNVELFMEVTPEGITIDSMETTIVDHNQANDLLRGALNGPPPEFLQSLMQMAGQMMDRSGAAGTATTSATSSTESTTQSSQTNVNSQSPTSGQNSQARGNTQTNPTTATHTRSTSRPHVHLAHQAMQGGFDPFLPCNSHHVAPRRRAPAQIATTQQLSQANRQENGNRPAGTTRPELFNVLNEVINNLRVVHPRRSSEPNPHTSTSNNESTNTSTQGSSSNNDISSLPPIASLFANLQGQNLPDLLRQSPTLEQLLQQFQDDSYVQGENIITDLVMLLVRNLSLIDIYSLNSGNLEPIQRNRVEIQNFIRTRVLDNNTTLEGFDRGVDRIINEMQPFFETFRSLSVRDDIDIVRSAETLIRHRLQNILHIVMNLNNNNVRLLLDQCLTTVKHLCALTLRASANGQQGLEQLFDHIMQRFMQEVPSDVQRWTLVTSRVHFRQVLSTLNIPDSILQPYIVRREVSLNSTEEVRENENNVGDNGLANDARPVEAMDLDEQEASSSGNELGSPPAILEDNEPLPNIIIGSEPWHAQVPQDWVPIIARDAQKQRRQNAQGPYSDAYLSGMPSKRRKIVNSAKPQGSLPQVIGDNVRQAVTATGLTSAAPLETVVQAAGESVEIQNAYRNLLRTTVQASLRDNEDFTPERYPNAANYFNNS